MDRVLVVDDNLSIQKLVSVNLQARGYAVDVAGTGEDALRLIQRRHIRSGDTRSHFARHERHRRVRPHPPAHPTSPLSC